MRKVLIYVEGQTEETFVRDVLAPYFQDNLLLIPTLARTKRTKAGRTFKGGIVSWAQVQRDIRGLLGDRSAVLVTTMIDYYGLPDDFPAMDSLPGGPPDRRVAYLERAFKEDIGSPRFEPFLVLHEFEAFVLVEPEALSKVFPEDKGHLPSLVRDIGGRPPEMIDEGPETHPAARILHYFPRYQKALHGPLITGRIGLGAIRMRCPHFDAWLRRLEALA